MKFLDVLKRKGFWVSVSAAIVILAQTLGLKIDVPIVNEILIGVCSILMLIGVISLKDKEDIESELNGDDEPNEEDENTNKNKK